MREAHLNRTYYATGWSHTDDTKRKMSLAKKNKCMNQKLSEEDVEYIKSFYKKYKFDINDCFKYDMIKSSQRKRLEQNGWDGKEALINKAGIEITNLHVVSFILSEQFNVTVNCIKATIKHKRKCYVS